MPVHQCVSLVLTMLCASSLSVKLVFVTLASLWRSICVVCLVWLVRFVIVWLIVHRRGITSFSLIISLMMSVILGYLSWPRLIKVRFRVMLIIVVITLVIFMSALIIVVVAVVLFRGLRVVPIVPILIIVLFLNVALSLIASFLTLLNYWWLGYRLLQGLWWITFRFDLSLWAYKTLSLSLNSFVINVMYVGVKKICYGFAVAARRIKPIENLEYDEETVAALKHAFHNVVLGKYICEIN